jgi:hypothetical protein
LILIALAALVILPAALLLRGGTYAPPPPPTAGSPIARRVQTLRHLRFSTLPKPVQVSGTAPGRRRRATRTRRSTGRSV